MTTDELIKIHMERLTAPFPFEAHKLRVVATNKDKKKGLIALYVDRSALLDRVVSVFGWTGWQTMRTEGPDAISCELSLNLGTAVKPLWIKKTGIGDKRGDQFPSKGGASDAFRLALKEFGCGHYAYGLPKEWVELDQYKQPERKAADRAMRKILATVGVRPGDARRSRPQNADAGAREKLGRLATDLSLAPERLPDVATMLGVEHSNGHMNDATCNAVLARLTNSVASIKRELTEHGHPSPSNAVAPVIMSAIEKGMPMTNIDESSLVVMEFLKQNAA